MCPSRITNTIISVVTSLWCGYKTHSLTRLFKRINHVNKLMMRKIKTYFVCNQQLEVKMLSTNNFPELSAQYEDFPHQRDRNNIAHITPVLQVTLRISYQSLLISNFFFSFTLVSLDAFLRWQKVNGEYFKHKYICTIITQTRNLPI